MLSSANPNKENPGPQGQNAGDSDQVVASSSPIQIAHHKSAGHPQAPGGRREARYGYRKAQAHPAAMSISQADSKRPKPSVYEARKPPLKLSDPAAWPLPTATRNLSPKAKVATSHTHSSRNAGFGGRRSGDVHGAAPDVHEDARMLGGLVGDRHGSLDSIQTQDIHIADAMSMDIISVSSALSVDIQSLSDSDLDSSEAYPEGTVTRCSTPSQEGRETVATESSSLPDNISLSLLTQEPRSVDALDNEQCGNEPCSLERRLEQRQKQIDYGKNTAGYERYTKMVPKSKRKRGDPQTPDKYASYSKRAWDGLVRVWRRKLHAWDPPGLPVSASHVAKLQRQAQQAADAAALAEEHNRVHCFGQGLEEGEIPQPTFAMVVGTRSLAFHRQLPVPVVPTPTPQAQSIVASGNGTAVPVFTILQTVPADDAAAVEADLEAMTNELKSMLLHPEPAPPSEEALGVDSEEANGEASVAQSETGEAIPKEGVDEPSVFSGTGMVQSGVDVAPEESDRTPKELEQLPASGVANEAAALPPVPPAPKVEVEIVISRARSPQLLSPSSIRSYNWADDADEEVDWEVTELNQEDGPDPISFDDKDCVTDREIEEGEIVE
ncbi:histone RNA hairpin-binding protein RNA-binding domain-containing protein [Hyaloraphidium curvatum]|nr:histone RNA hairpin-binding protein RNA-binding domain-containing protein [Hyaloraphidium curvatum]